MKDGWLGNHHLNLQVRTSGGLFNAFESIVLRENHLFSSMIFPAIDLRFNSLIHCMNPVKFQHLKRFPPLHSIPISSRTIPLLVSHSFHPYLGHLSVVPLSLFPFASTDGLAGDDADQCRAVSLYVQHRNGFADVSFSQLPL